MTKAIKLTPAQKELLLDAPTHCIENYAPAKRLIALGLATYHQASLSNGEIRLTQAGQDLAESLRG